MKCYFMKTRTPLLIDISKKIFVSPYLTDLYLLRKEFTAFPPPLWYVFPFLGFISQDNNKVLER